MKTIIFCLYNCLNSNLFVHVIGSPGSGDYGMEMDMDGMHGEMDDMDDMEGMDGYGDEGVDMVRYDF